VDKTVRLFEILAIHVLWRTWKKLGCPWPWSKRASSV